MTDYMPEQPINDYAREAVETKLESVEENVFETLSYEVSDVVNALNELECGIRYMLEYRGLDTDWRRYDGEFFVNLKNAIDYFGG
jgi:hypothetical protein